MFFNGAAELPLGVLDSRQFANLSSCVFRGRAAAWLSLR